MFDASEIGLNIRDDASGPHWSGFTSCSICGYGTPSHEIKVAVSVIPMDPGQDEPVVAMECPWCRNMTLQPTEAP
jgi:hypothetical protein